MGAFAWVTLATNDSYSLGALVLAHSLRRVGTQHDLAVLITPGVTQPMREKLAAVFTVVQEVNVLDSKDEANLAVLQRPELGITFTKLHCWRFTQYEKCVFVDADALVVRNCDELFERDELSAAPDVGWPDCFNSGVFVFKPSQETFSAIAAFAASQGSFDGADQGLLNSYFSDWAHKDISKHLPFIYNMCATATYSYVPAFKQYGASVKIVHFIANTKPWLQYFDTMTGIVQSPFGCDYLQPLLQMWWNIFCECVHPQLSDVMATSNMTTIWHYSDLFFAHSRHKADSIHCLDDETFNEFDRGPPDFSTFHDPWDDYTAPQTNNDQQYYCATTSDDQFQNLSLPPCPVETSETSHQTYDTDRLDDDRQTLTNDGVESLSENLSQLSAFCDFIDDFCEDNSQYNNDHRNNEFEQSNISSSEPSCSYHSSEQSQDINSDREEKSTDCHDPFSSSTESPPCTDPNNVATRSESNAAPNVDSAEGGLAGALSKLTMGEARTDEQRAIEDHMRKTNWEQGQIDFMGRDSFDNIMKKINETLATAPTTRQTTPLKETGQPKKSSSESGEVEADVEDSQAATPVLETEDLSKSSIVQVPAEDACQRIPDKSSPLETVEAPAAPPSTESASTIDENVVPTLEESVPTTQTADVPKSSVPVGSTEPQTTVDVKQTETISDSPISPESQAAPVVSEADALLSSTDLTTSIYCEPSASVPSEPEQAAQQSLAQVVSEATTECPVPIQVAESVLQAEPKETVSEDPRPVIEAVASSITPSVQESAASVSEALIQPEGSQPADQASHPPQLNGDDPYLQSQAAEIVPPSSEPLAQPSPPVIPEPQEQPAPADQGEAAKPEEPLPPAAPEDKEESSACEKPKLTVKLPQSETSETQAEAEAAVAEPEKAPPSADSLPAPEQETPVRPNRSKELKIPGTPTVTGPTPPTSPPFVTEAALTSQEEPQPQAEVVASEKPETPAEAPVQETPAEPQATAPAEEASAEPKAEQQQQQQQAESEKASKKIAKKSSAESDSPPESEGSSKKTVKKVVKKVGKKPKEAGDAEEGGSEEKSKKGTKAVRKLSKASSTSLETEPAVLDTPPPSGSSEPPVPPKRKAKSSSSTKVTDKKPDES